MIHILMTGFGHIKSLMWSIHRMMSQPKCCELVLKKLLVTLKIELGIENSSWTVDVPISIKKSRHC